MGLWGTWTGSREGLSEMALSMVIDVIDPVRTSRCSPRGRSVYFVTCSAARNMSSPQVTVLCRAADGVRGHHPRLLSL